MKNVYAKYLFCTCKYLLQRVLLQMIHEQVCVMIKMIKSINLLIQNSRPHKNYIFLAKPFLWNHCLSTAQTVSPFQRIMLVRMSSENKNTVITVDPNQTKCQSYECSTVLECWWLINLNILQS